ncbi:DNA methyltransferase [Demequina sp.]|uniref:site-specific DNA-methyltransferase n=1 Tax=Demequina sp. TaxID=2050685 RepID=UPI0025BDE873|nr:DNA methyltransferase [Demequina sp.]
MSRLTDLIRQAKAKDPQLGTDLEAEVRELTRRRSFGLVFERHQPEAVELPGVTVSVGSKVRVLPPRGETAKGDQRLWRVIGRDKTAGTVSLVELTPPADAEAESAEALVDDVVVVMEFEDRMFPGLVETGRVERGGDAPFHTVINGENFHALQMLTYTHRGKIDAIYIDPPYNTGAKDWKYNNDYVEGDDAYRHSKWLAMMERRLLLARELLNPDDSVLIVTIDEKEILRLGLLLEQTFPGAEIQMVSIVINRAGSPRIGMFSRVDEYAFYVFVGDASVKPWTSTMLGDDAASNAMPTVWFTAVRRGSGSAREDKKSGKASFYPVVIDAKTGALIRIGDPVPHGVPRDEVPLADGELAMWPLANDGTENRWRFSADRMREYFERGTARLGRRDPRTGLRPVTYLQPGTLENIENGTFVVTGRTEEGSLELALSDTLAKVVGPRTVWNRTAHFARDHGSNLNSALLGGRRFPFPKSLYAVEDSLRFVVADKPNALVLDFFSGSGTTAHAVMRLNKQDGGRRQVISVTNNEVGADEQKQLRKDGLRPGDPEWEKFGICDYITKPRIEAAITGNTPDGEAIKGDYKFTDEFPMADGFEQNAAFFTLTYEQPMTVARDRAFARIAPLLWMRAGSTGRVLDDVGEDGWDVSDTYGVLADADSAPGFIAAVAERPTLRTAFVITDEDAVFRSVARDLPEHVEPVRLYESYLHTFEVGGGVA